MIGRAVMSPGTPYYIREGDWQVLGHYIRHRSMTTGRIRWYQIRVHTKFDAKGLVASRLKRMVYIGAEDTTEEYDGSPNPLLSPPNLTRIYVSHNNTVVMTFGSFLAPKSFGRLPCLGSRYLGHVCYDCREEEF